ncbi:MAG: cryptochrome/photolyase family protein [bacterium]|nr:cryptochrome/photolyase family protein [bacterium]
MSRPPKSTRATPPPKTTRHLILILGDQLNADAAAFDGFDPAQDGVWLAEVAGESTHVTSTKPRIAIFLAAMRHFREAQRATGRRVTYVTLDDPANTHTLGTELARAAGVLRPTKLIMTEPGEWRVRAELVAAAARLDVPLEIRADRHFLCSAEEFRAHAEGRKQLRMEFFYREMRRRHRVLLDATGEPEGGQWNFDHDTRGRFPQGGPVGLRAPVAFPPDALTAEVLALVRTRFAAHPGELDHFDWPLTPAQGRAALQDFIAHRLRDFGTYQDALWTDEPWLYHSRLSAAMNLKLLDPREVLAAAEQAYRSGAVPLAAAEGFIRQILGWREYVRGIYWLRMPDYAATNALRAEEPLPEFYWSGKTDMACLRAAIGQTMQHGHAHHIQRLMVTGLYSLLLGVRPAEICAWYLGVYVDAVEWVELPNTHGMSQYADGGLLASKPYVATGNYIARMSNYCAGCRFDPAKRTGDDACPFTTLYWDFLHRHSPLLAANQRMALQVKNLARIGAPELAAIQARAAAIRAHGGAPPSAGGQTKLALKATPRRRK